MISVCTAAFFGGSRKRVERRVQHAQAIEMRNNKSINTYRG